MTLPTTSSRVRPFLWSLLPPLLLFASTVALFAPSLTFSLVNFDDPVFITNNPIVTDGFSWQSVPRAFTALHGDGCMYTPLLWLSFLVDTALFGASSASPWGFHLTNVLLHAANAVLLWSILLALVRRPWIAFLAAAFWALHPFRVESVAWVTERKDTLSTVFAFLSILFYLKAFLPRGRTEGTPPSSTVPRARGMLFLAWLAFAAGLLAKPMLVTLPFLFLLFDVWPLRRIPATPLAALRALLSLALRKWPFFFLSAVCVVATKILQSGATVHLPLLQRLYWLPSNYFFYLVKSFYPVALIPMCPGLSVAPAFIAGVSLCFLVLAIVALRAFRVCPGFAIGLAAFAGLLFPVSGVVFIGNYPVADRYSYLPAIGLSIALLALLDAFRRAHAPLSRLLFPALCLALLPLAAATHRILPAWKDSDALYARIAAFLPSHYGVQCFRFSRAFTTRGDLSEAADAANLVFDSTPVHPRSLLLKTLVISQTDGTSAALDFQAAHPIENPSNQHLDSLHLVLAALSADAGRPDDAARHLALAADVPPLDRSVSPDAFHAAAAWILWRSNRPDDALSHLRLVPALAHAAALSPQSLLRPSTAVWNLGLRRQALPSLLDIARQSPADPELLNNVAWLLATTPGSPADPADAVAFARLALDAIPGHPVIQDTLATACAFAGRFDEAVALDSDVAALLRLSPASTAPIVLTNVEHRLDLFRQRRPYVEPAAAALLLGAP